MMVLTGNVGKSVVLQSLVETHKSICALVYDENPILTVESMYISSKDLNVEELCNVLRIELGKECKGSELFVIYTNLHEADTFAIKDVMKEFEQNSWCRYGILMCKE